MSNIDLSQLITAQDKAVTAAQERATVIKSEVQAQIYAVADQNTQASLLAAAVVGNLSAQQLAVFSAGQEWIEATKSAGRQAILEGGDPVWPEVPAGVADLVEQF